MLEELEYRIRGWLWLIGVAGRAMAARATVWMAELERRGRARSVRSIKD